MLKGEKLSLISRIFYETNAIVTAPVGSEIFLSSGLKSPFYLDCRRVLLSAYASSLIVPEFHKLMRRYLKTQPEKERIYLGSIGVGGSCLLAAILNYAGRRDFNWRGFILREHVKEHGVESDIEGHLPVDGESSHILMIDDVLTTGRTVEDACDRIKIRGHYASGIFTLIDREQGGPAFLADEGYHVESLLTASQLYPPRRTA